jgi:hypothetical protein
MSRTIAALSLRPTRVPFRLSASVLLVVQEAEWRGIVAAKSSFESGPVHLLLHATPLRLSLREHVQVRMPHILCGFLAVQATSRIRYYRFFLQALFVLSVLWLASMR